MNQKQIEDSIAYCGLVCTLCQPNGNCNCKTMNHCGKKESKQGCYQYTCCIAKGLNGCWECNVAPCGKDMLAPDKIKLRAFIRCIKEDGIETFASYLLKHHNKGLQYHYHNSILGDYDLQTEEEILQLLRSES